VFVVLYNSCPAWTALLSRFILGKKLNWVQVGGVGLVCVGLIMNVFGSQQQLKNNDDGSTTGMDDSIAREKEDAQQSFWLVAGSAIVLVGSLLHSLMFVLSDMAMSSPLRHYEEFGTTALSSLSLPLPLDAHDSIDVENEKKRDGGHDAAVTGLIWSCCLGSLETCFMTAWVSIGIWMYGFDDESSDASDESSSSSSASASASASEQQPLHIHTMAIGGFLGLVLIASVHAAAFFTLLKNMGAVASALLKGVQAIVVVGLSAMFYCPTEKSQCLTWIKSLSAIIVLSGVMGYGVGSTSRKTDANVGGSRNNSRSRLYDGGSTSPSNSFEMSNETKSVVYYSST